MQAGNRNMHKRIFLIFVHKIFNIEFDLCIENFRCPFRVVRAGDVLPELGKVHLGKYQHPHGSNFGKNPQVVVHILFIVILRLQTENDS